MDMRINSNLVRKLRADATWSQEELAAASGLSLRTIQRVEADGVAAVETQRALAAAFKLHPKDLEFVDPANDPRRIRFGMGVLASWIGIAWLAGLGWGIGLIGVGAIYIFSQVSRVIVDKLPPLWGWVGVGSLFVLGGIDSLLDLEVPIAPLSVIVVGLCLILSARGKKPINGKQ